MKVWVRKVKMAAEIEVTFDDACPNWHVDPEVTVMFLKGVRGHLNMVKAARGHVFLNEAYDMLGLPRTRIGAQAGWLAGDDEDFGIIHRPNENNFLLTFAVRPDITNNL